MSSIEIRKHNDYDVVVSSFSPRVNIPHLFMEKNKSNSLSRVNIPQIFIESGKMGVVDKSKVQL